MTRREKIHVNENRDFNLEIRKHPLWTQQAIWRRAVQNRNEITLSNISTIKYSLRVRQTLAYRNISGSTSQQTRNISSQGSCFQANSDQPQTIAGRWLFRSPFKKASPPPLQTNQRPKQQNKKSILNLTLNKQIATPQAPFFLASTGEEEALKGLSAVERTAWQVQLTFCSFLVVTILLNCFEILLWKTKMISLNSRYRQYLTILTII